jgi:hypothetical protein
MEQEKEVNCLDFDITGQKAYMKNGPHRDQLGMVKRNFAGSGTEYTLIIGGELYVDVELQDLVLVDVDFKEFHDWCERNGYI